MEIENRARVLKVLARSLFARVGDPYLTRSILYTHIRVVYILCAEPRTYPIDLEQHCMCRVAAIKTWSKDFLAGVYTTNKTHPAWFLYCPADYN